MNTGTVRLLATALLLLGTPTQALAVTGTVHLKNGGWIQGDLTEVLPEDHVTVRLNDGSTREVPWSDVDHVEQAPQPSEPSAPPAIDAQQPVAPPSVPVANSPAAPPPVPPAQASSPIPAAEQPASADATLKSKRTTLAFFGLAGFGGEASGHLVAESGGQTNTMSLQADLKPTYGFGAQLDVPLHAYVSIGVLGRAMWVGGEKGTDKILFVDAAVAPRLRYPFSSTGDSWGALFLQVPVGIAYVNGPDADRDLVAMFDSFDDSVSPAFVIGVDAGVQFLFSEHAGLVFEVGWLHHAFTDTIRAALGSERLTQTTDFQTGQLTLQGGVVFAL